MIGIGLSGHFDIRVVNAKTGVVREQHSFDNTILNTGLDHYCKNDFSSAAVALGTGTNAEDPTQTGLTSQTYMTKGVYAKYGVVAPQAPDYVGTGTITWRIPANAAVGNFTEIGICEWEFGRYFWCRALIRDESGNVSTLTVLADEYVDVIYTLRYHPDLNDRTFSFVMNGVTYNCVARRAYIATSPYNTTSGPLYFSIPGIYWGGSGSGMWGTQTLGPITGGPTGAGASLNGEKRTKQTYETGTYTVKVLMSWGLEFANIDGGIGSLVVAGGSPDIPTQINFTPKIPKDNTNELSLMFAIRFYRWGE